MKISPTAPANNVDNRTSKSPSLAKLKIDIHTHILPREIPRFMDKFGYGGFIQLEHLPCGQKANMVGDDGKFFREIEHNCWDPAVRLQEIHPVGNNDVHHVQVLSTVPIMFSYWAKAPHTLEVSRFLNDQVASVVEQYPKSYVGLGTLPMQDPAAAARELHRCMRTLGLRGVQIGSHIAGTNLNHPSLHEFYQEAQNLGAAIFVHPWDMMGTDTLNQYWLPWLVAMPAETSRAICSLIFGGIFERFPKLKVAFAHGGGSFPFTLGRIEQGHRVRPDLCAKDNPHNPRNYLDRLIFDTLVHDAQALQFLLQLMGPKQLALGSDYPFPLGEHPVGSILDSLPLSAQERDHIHHLTALRWLGMQKQDFLENK